MKKLSTKVGSFTDRYLIKLLKTYRIEHRCGQALLNELCNNGKSYWCKFEWTKWIDGLRDVEDGLLCAVGADWGVMNELLYRKNWDEIMSEMSELQMLKAMKESVDGMKLVMDLIEFEEVRKSTLAEDWKSDSLEARALTVVEIVLRMTAIRHGYEDLDARFYRENGLTDQGVEKDESKNNESENDESEGGPYGMTFIFEGGTVTT